MVVSYRINSWYYAYTLGIIVIFCHKGEDTYKLLWYIDSKNNLENIDCKNDTYREVNAYTKLYEISQYFSDTPINTCI